MKLSQLYIDLLSKKVSEKLGKEYNIKKYGVRKEEKEKLLEGNYPQDLIEFLETLNGSNCPIVGTLDGEIAYNLFSAYEMLITKMDGTYQCVKEIYEYDETCIDKRIKIDGELQWILIGEDVINNGGWSKLYIDMTPSELGIKGQVVQYIHDEDEFKVIANSFKELLENIIKNEFNFVNDYSIIYFDDEDDEDIYSDLDAEFDTELNVENE